jgi:hypothetical protein
MLLIEFAGASKSLRHLLDAELAHFVFHISGRTKGNQLSGAKFGLPCIGTTHGTDLRPGLWVNWLVRRMKGDGVRGERLFQRRLSPSKLMEFEHDFYTLLERVQSGSGLMDKDINVREDFGILRLSRRSFTCHAKNMLVPEEWINALNRWTTEANSQTGVPRLLDMSDVYSTLDALKPLFLRITQLF